VVAAIAYMVFRDKLRMWMGKGFFIFSFFFWFIGFTYAQFPGPAGSPGSTALYKDSSIFKAWAKNCIVNRGFKNIADTTLGKADVGKEEDATGKPKETGGVLSLGDGGVAVLTFNKPIFNGLGPDFAVFENGFSDDFLELAFVEVSSDGKHFVRFPSVSLIQNQTQTGPFDYGGKAEQLHNLAGKYQLFYGTPFDLEDLKGSSAVDLDSITHVRIVDVVGSISSPFAQKDSKGNIINDPYPTAFGSGGFDLDAVGVIHEKLPEAGCLESKSFIYPIPASDFICLKPLGLEANWHICDAFGRMVWSGVLKNEEIKVPIAGLKSGMYFFKLQSEGTPSKTIRFSKI